MKITFIPLHPYIRESFDLFERWKISNTPCYPQSLETAVPEIKKACLECLVFMGFKETKAGKLTHEDRYLTSILTEIATLNFRAINRTDGVRTLDKIYSDESAHGALIEEILYETLNTLLTTLDRTALEQVCHNVYRTLILSSTEDPLEDEKNIIKLYKEIHVTYPTFWILWYMHLVIKDRFIYTPERGA